MVVVVVVYARKKDNNVWVYARDKLRLLFGSMPYVYILCRNHLITDGAPPYTVCTRRFRILSSYIFGATPSCTRHKKKKNIFHPQSRHTLWKNGYNIPTNKIFSMSMKALTHQHKYVRWFSYSLWCVCTYTHEKETRLRPNCFACQLASQPAVCCRQCSSGVNLFREISGRTENLVFVCRQFLELTFLQDKKRIMVVTLDHSWQVSAKNVRRRNYTHYIRGQG